MSNRYRCDACETVVGRDEWDIVQDPKEGSDMEWIVCRTCRSAECFTKLCCREGCDNPVSMGLMNKDTGEYEFLCGEHGRAHL